MNAVKTRKIWKQLIICFSLLLFLFSYDTSLYTQTRISKPGNLNSWKPAHLLPAYDNTPIDSVIRTDFTIIMRDGVIIDCLKWVSASCGSCRRLAYGYYAPWNWGAVIKKRCLNSASYRRCMATIL